MELPDPIYSKEACKKSSSLYLKSNIQVKGDCQKYKVSPIGQGRNISLNACVGKNGGPYDFYSYGAGYFKAGHVLAQKLIDAESGKHSNSEQKEQEFFVENLVIDVVIYPVLYLYRQGTTL